MPGVFFFPLPATSVAPGEPEEPDEEPEEPGRPLLEEGDRDEGDTGPVHDLQHRLNAHGAYPQLVEDGIFGPNTTAALITFQGSRGLEVTATTDEATWAALDEEPPPLPPGGPRPNDPQVQYWVGKFEGIASSFWSAHYGRLSKRPLDIYQAYRCRHAFEAYAALWEATGDTGYLNKGVQLLDTMIDGSVSVSGGYRGWKTTTRSGYENEEVPLDESHCLAPAFRLVRVMPPGAKRDELRDWLIRNVFEKWRNRGYTRNITRDSTHMSSHWAIAGMNLHAALPGTLSWGLTASEQSAPANSRSLRYAALDILSKFAGNVRPHPTGGEASMIWAVPFGATSPIQDVSHGNAVVSMLIDAHDLGIALIDPGTRQPIDVIPRLVHLVEFLHGRGEPDLIDGSGRDANVVFSEWVKLGGFDAALQDELASRTPSTLVNSDGAHYANMARNAARLAS